MTVIFALLSLIFIWRYIACVSRERLEGETRRRLKRRDRGLRSDEID